MTAGEHLVVCTACQKKLAEGKGLSWREAFSVAFRHEEHRDDEVLIIGLAARPGRVDVITRSGFPVSRRQTGQPAGIQYQDYPAVLPVVDPAVIP